MHSFLSAVGFSNIKNLHQLNFIYKQVLESPTRKIITHMDSDTNLVQISKDFADGIGISLIGEVSPNGFLSIEHYFPYVNSNILTKTINFSAEEYKDKKAYAGLCNNYNLGMTLIFFISNTADYEKSKLLNNADKKIKKAYFSGLSTKGIIILNINKENESRSNNSKNGKRSKLIEAARNGDPAAIERLTLEDMDTCNIIEKRTHSEDILSIVESSFMPIGVETDHYAVIGTIIECRKAVNSVTSESIWLLDVECNDLIFTIAINTKDLMGEPYPGRRFKGDIWLQGRIEV